MKIINPKDKFDNGEKLRTMLIDETGVLNKRRTDLIKINSYSEDLNELIKSSWIKIRNLKIELNLGLKVGDFFIDKNGEYGVFFGCLFMNSNYYGRFLDRNYFNVVTPVKKVTFEEMKNGREKNS